MNKDTYIKVSKTLGISPDIIEKVYKAYWLFIKTTIQALPLKEDLTEEEFLKLKTNFNISSLGKLSCTKDKYKSTLERFKLIKRLKDAKDK